MTPLAAAAGMLETPEKVAVLADCASNIDSAASLRSSHLLPGAHKLRALAGCAAVAAAKANCDRLSATHWCLLCRAQASRSPLGASRV